MELTKEERKILGDAVEGHLKLASKRRWLLPFVVMGIIGATMMIVDGVKTLASGNEGWKEISFASVLIGFMMVSYENIKFRAVAFSLICKLTNERPTSNLT
jgi:hypothetical protein